KIQKVGKNYIKDGVSFILFDVKIVEYWLERHNVDDIAEKLQIQSVPVIGSGTVQEMIDVVKKGFNSIFGDFTAEGIVARPEVELFSRSGHRIITKIKHRDF
ncbi:MAG: hypothetical protein GY754_10600, partial [bacterium]|nr:hypothetical protein [bacterium]